MISFKNDYSEGAHVEILNKLMETNLVQQNGYGEDFYSNKAKERIKELINDGDADVHLVSGGTQSNLIVIDSILKSYESVVSAATGHINVHETGAIEATGHKVNIAEHNDGKLYPESIKEILDFHIDEHMVVPKVVYISNATEIGTIYTKDELKALSDFCKDNDLYLFMDGARLGSALMSEENDLTLEDVANYTDVFYIGGTKNGALLGEAVVITNDDLKDHFRFYLKQRGALLAKGRVIGIQFLELLKGNLFFDLALNANTMAQKLKAGIKKYDYEFLSETSTNQIFPIMPNDIIEELHQKYKFHIWEPIDEEKSIIRLVTSWATTDEMVRAFLEDLGKLS
jgi:threonine aldolase